MIACATIESHKMVIRTGPSHCAQQPSCELRVQVSLVLGRTGRSQRPVCGLKYCFTTKIFIMNPVMTTFSRYRMTPDHLRNEEQHSCCCSSACGSTPITGLSGLPISNAA